MAQQDGSWDSFNSEDTCSCKVGRGIRRYSIEGINEEMVRLWKKEDIGLRRLADHFNREVIRMAMRDAGIQPLEGENENIRRILTDSDVTDGMRVQLHKRFESYGVDIDELVEDFVSYQTVNRHLKRCLEVEPPSKGAATITREDGADRIFGLQKRTETVIENTLDQLKRAEEIDLGEFEVTISVGVSCTDCETYREVQQLLEEGCECHPT